MATTTPKRGEGAAQTASELAISYWKENVRLIYILLAIWAGVSIVAGYFLAGALSGINLGNVPLSFWIVQQGAIIVFVALIFIYARLMDGLDKKYDVHE